jgi:hypothetical protein
MDVPWRTDMTVRARHDFARFGRGLARSVQAKRHAGAAE